MSELFVGQTIKKIRKMTEKEMLAEGWGDTMEWHVPTVLVLSNGAKIYASQDDEGNSPGALFGAKGKDHFYIQDVE